MSLHPFLQRLGISYPIIQAPMAGGSTTPELVAAVSNHGGLGSFAGAYLAPKQIEESVAKIRTLTKRPFAVNIFGEVKTPDGDRDGLIEKLKYFYAELGASAPPAPGAPTDFRGQIESLVALRLPVVSFTLGKLDANDIARLQAVGSVVIGTATNIEEALQLEATGVDAVVAQGSEAGGHRGTFATPYWRGLIGTIALVPQMVDAVKIPVIASGGIMDSRGVRAALELGAVAAQIGTAFMTCRESGLPDSMKEALLRTDETATVVQRAWSGKWARAVKNRVVEAYENESMPQIEFWEHNRVTRPIRDAAAKQNRPELMGLYAGQGTRLLRRESAAEFMDRLIAGLKA